MAEGAVSYQHVLLATDLNESAPQVAARALSLARQSGARLSLVHVVEYVPVEFPSEVVLPSDFELEEHLVRQAEERLKRFAEDQGMGDSKRYIEVGATKYEILRVAEENAVDLIVIGSHGRSGFARLLGSTANAVLHGAPCDVLAVRVKKGQG
jgi:universal stress protein A